MNTLSLSNAKIQDYFFTTAHDLYRITKEALSHELFATICNTVKHTVPATNLSDERTLSNTNGLISSLANTSADGGTNTAAMAENLKKIGTRFQIRIKVLDSLANSRDFRNLLKAYNRAASKLKKEKVENEHDWSGFWDNADGEVLKLARAGSPSQVDRWLNAIKPYIMAGIPVFWSVQLGIVPEPLRLSQTRGGHLRLITGFDEEKKTLIFSDSWGAAHTEKEMPLADAIAITTGRQVMQPSK